jgi:hypothetical protein
MEKTRRNTKKEQNRKRDRLLACKLDYGDGRRLLGQRLYPGTKPARKQF